MRLNRGEPVTGVPSEQTDMETKVEVESQFNKVTEVINNPMSAVSIKESARQPSDSFTQDLQTSNWTGQTVLNPAEETRFRNWITQTPWYSEFQMDHGRVPDLDDPDFDYRGMWKSWGNDSFEQVEHVDPNGEKYMKWHGPSRTPSGKWLKTPSTHETAWKELMMQVPGMTENDINRMTRTDAARLYAAWKEGNRNASKDKEPERSPLNPVPLEDIGQEALDGMNFGEAFKPVMKNPATVEKGRFIWRGRPYSTQYATRP